MKMELGVDSKPKEHPSARICRQLAPPAAGRRHRERIAVDDKLWQRLLAGHYKAIGAKDFTGDTMLHWRDRCAPRMRWMLPTAVHQFHRSIPGVRSRDSQPTTVVRVDMGTTKSGS
jgi:hypothetical protein